MSFFLIVMLGLLGGVKSNELDRATCTIPSGCANWSYEGETGPDFWGDIDKVKYAACKGGTSQSPIDIDTIRATKVSLGKISFGPGYSQASISGKFENNGETLVFTPDSNAGLTITGGPYGTSTYNFAQFHFHWGCSNERGSEHRIDGARYSLEMHLVHIKSTYASLDVAKANKDGLAVLGLLFSASSANSYYCPFEFFNSRLYSATQPKGAAVTGQVNLASFIQSINPSVYYTYFGSLTTPGCEEAVTWTVFPQIIKINSQQMDSFRQLLNCACHQGCDNYRPSQTSRTVKLNLS